MKTPKRISKKNTKAREDEKSKLKRNLWGNHVSTNVFLRLIIRKKKNARGVGIDKRKRFPPAECQPVTSGFQTEWCIIYQRCHLNRKFTFTLQKKKFLIYS